MSITLCDATKQPLVGTTTNECGCYEFCDLAAQLYYIKFSLPKGYKIISGNVTTPTYSINTITAVAEVFSSSATVNNVSITIG